MSKKLITSGCSFSECISPWIETWPKHLARSLPEYDHVSKAMGSQGNGLISRGIIYEVSKTLENTPAQDILVGIMWSGYDRQDFYLSQPTIDVHDGYMENPTSFTGSSPRWVIVNHNWRNQYARNWYGGLHDDVGAQIYTYEHVMRTQMFLEKYNVPYFMTTYTNRVFETQHSIHPEVIHLHKLIDWSKFLPVAGEYEWCRDNSGIPFPVENDPHPGSAQHLAFVTEVILPFIGL